MNGQHLYFVSRSEAIRHQINETIDKSARKCSSNWFSTTARKKEFYLLYFAALHSIAFFRGFSSDKFAIVLSMPWHLTNALLWPLHSYALFTVCTFTGCSFVSGQLN